MYARDTHTTYTHSAHSCHVCVCVHRLDFCTSPSGMQTPAMLIYRSHALDAGQRYRALFKFPFGKQFFVGQQRVKSTSGRNRDCHLCVYKFKNFRGGEVKIKLQNHEKVQPITYKLSLVKNKPGKYSQVLLGRNDN
jgi:hypothetical protein